MRLLGSFCDTITFIFSRDIGHEYNAGSLYQRSRENDKEDRQKK